MKQTIHYYNECFKYYLSSRTELVDPDKFEDFFLVAKKNDNFIGLNLLGIELCGECCFYYDSWVYPIYKAIEDVKNGKYT